MSDTILEIKLAIYVDEKKLDGLMDKYGLQYPEDVVSRLLAELTEEIEVDEINEVEFFNVEDIN